PSRPPATAAQSRAPARRRFGGPDTRPVAGRDRRLDRCQPPQGQHRLRRTGGAWRDPPSRPQAPLPHRQVGGPRQGLRPLIVPVRSGVSPSLAGVAVLISLLALWMFSQDIVRGTLRERTFDLLLPHLPRSEVQAPGVTIVDIDRAALARFGPWPWPRNRLAEI